MSNHRTPLTYHIETWGCQMNVHDSEQLADALERVGYSRAEGPESASVIVLNTCSVREKAAQKVFTRLGRLAGLKSGGRALRPPNGKALHEPLLCVAGCVAQQEGQEIIERQPLVDLVLGTRRTFEIGDLVERVRNGEGPLISTDLETAVIEPPDEPANRLSPWKAYVTIIEGCDNFCAYCIVPLVRGREKSRDSGSILEEVSRLVASGVLEIELLGQNVNSYRDDQGVDFTELLRRVAETANLRRLRFTVSHPRDFTPRLASLISKIPIICRHLHLPLQSGSNRVLKAMGRGYTREQYLEKLTHLRSLIPEITLSTDLIVGFPGETTEDFQDTLSMLKTVRYDATFSFMYNPRPGTRAAQLKDDVSDDEKHHRLQELLKLQKAIQTDLHRSLVGCELEVLVEGESRRGRGQFFGRDGGNRVVNFNYAPQALKVTGDPADPRGRLVKIKVTKAHPNSLSGTLVGFEDMP